MLCRVSCKLCHISCLWTDDPKGFLESVCLRYRHCQAKLLDEGFGQVVVPRRRATTPRVGIAKGASARGPAKHLHP